MHNQYYCGPKSIQVIGGGLWSRVIAQSLCEIVPHNIKIGIHSPRNYTELCEWVTTPRINSRVCVFPSPPKLNQTKGIAFIIANAARDHAQTAERILPSQIPILVEKPLTLYATETQRLIDIQAETGGRIAASQVFLFNRYLYNFIKKITAVGSITKISFTWTDPHKELRHGELKSYDASLPAHVDVLPHISAMLYELLPGTTISNTKLTISKGGANEIINLDMDEIPITIYIARNATCRNRIIEVTTPKEILTLDFTSEPQIITKKQGSIAADADWHTKKKPLATMLSAYLNGVHTGVFDERFSLSKALQGNLLSDHISILYKKSIHDWLLNSLLLKNTSSDECLMYALQEQLLFTSQSSRTTVYDLATTVLKQLRGATKRQILDFLSITL